MALPMRRLNAPGLRGAAQHSPASLARIPANRKRILHNGVRGSRADPSDLDCIMVLAGGLQRNGNLPLWVTRRLDSALALFNQQSPSCSIVCLGGGTPHKPDVLSSSGHVLHESTSCAQYLVDRGTPALNIFKETSSYDTVGNAYFSLTVHAIPAGWRRIGVITSAFHLSRTETLFRDIYGFAAKQIFADPDWFRLTFVEASDDGVFSNAVLEARHAKEIDSIRHWQSQRARLHSLGDFHRWLYSEHLCYAVQQQRKFGVTQQIHDPQLLASY